MRISIFQISATSHFPSVVNSDLRKAWRTLQTNVKTSKYESHIAIEEKNRDISRLKSIAGDVVISVEAVFIGIGNECKLVFRTNHCEVAGKVGQNGVVHRELRRLQITPYVLKSRLHFYASRRLFAYCSICPEQHMSSVVTYHSIIHGPLKMAVEGGGEV